MEKKNQYQSPQVKVVEFRVELGAVFSAQSTEPLIGSDSQISNNEQLTHGWTHSFQN